MNSGQEIPPSLFLRGLGWVIGRLTPREGWMSFLLIVVIVVGISNAIWETEWVAEIGRIWLNGLVAATWATVITKQIRSKIGAWTVLIISGLLFTAERVGDLIPPVVTWWDGSWSDLAATQITLFSERLQLWWERLATGSPSTETLPFTFGVGMVVWLLSALLAWQTYRTHRPLPALILICFGVAAVGYFSPSPTHWLLQTAAGAIGLAALMRFVRLQMRWEQDGIDYPDSVIYDFALAVTIFAILFPLLGYLSPRIALPPVARAFAGSRGVKAIEGELERIFAGVNVRNGGRGGAAGSSAGVGIMPRLHLLTGSPELLESVVMTATVQGDAEALHWRALSYDNYVGSGWEISAENRSDLPANVSIPHQDGIATAPLSQTVYWLQDNRSTRYSLGRPAQFDQPVTLQWRGRTDLVRVRGEGNVYQVQSQVSVATPAQLAQVSLTDVPSEIIGRYTQLPNTVPQRVLDLAIEVTASAETPYDKAKALETFLRQYEYSLEIDAPPADQDVADFFLFEQQIGYCDYYATTMTVLARHVGLPARMVIGYAAAPTIDGTQTLRGIDAHSWTEIHFGEYGWIGFEPTGGFAVRGGAVAADASTTTFPEPPPIPTRTAPLRQIVILTLISLLIIAGIAFVVWRTLLPPPLPDTETRYAQLQQHAARLAVPALENQTPLEFLAQFEQRLHTVGQRDWIRRRTTLNTRLNELRDIARTLTYDFIAVQYGQAVSETNISRRQWQRVRRLLWFLQGTQLFVDE